MGGGEEGLGLEGGFYEWVRDYFVYEAVHCGGFALVLEKCNLCAV
jgi:hypothetical protein